MTSLLVITSKAVSAEKRRKSWTGQMTWMDYTGRVSVNKTRAAILQKGEDISNKTAEMSHLNSSRVNDNGFVNS